MPSSPTHFSSFPSTYPHPPPPFFFFLKDPAPPEFSPLPHHAPLPIEPRADDKTRPAPPPGEARRKTAGFDDGHDPATRREYFSERMKKFFTRVRPNDSQRAFDGEATRVARLISLGFFACSSVVRIRPSVNKLCIRIDC